MIEYSKPISIRWADLDPNFHLRHSVYYDFAAQVRTQFLIENGVTPQVMAENHFGPILFREECIFRREIKIGDPILINVKVLKLADDLSRFTIQHEFLHENGKLCAILTVEGAWMDTKIRKLTVPPLVAQEMINDMPKSENFEWVKRKPQENNTPAI